MRKSGRSLFSIADMDRELLESLVDRSVSLYDDPGQHDRPLRDLVVGILFTRTSTRTRTAFTVGMVRLGGTPISYGPGDLQLNTGESIEDTGRTLALMLDGLVARTAGPMAEMRMLTAAGLPVVNAMAAEEHPTQAIADLATLRRHFGRLDGLRLLYVGEGNNTATALAHALARVSGARAVFATPPGYGLPAATLAAAADCATESEGSVREVHNLDEVPDDVDVVYTTRWQTTGSSKPDPAWREVFRPYHVDHRWLDRRPGGVLCMTSRPIAGMRSPATCCRTTGR